MQWCHCLETKTITMTMTLSLLSMLWRRANQRLQYDIVLLRVIVTVNVSNNVVKSNCYSCNSSQCHLRRDWCCRDTIVNDNGIVTFLKINPKKTWRGSLVGNVWRPERECKLTLSTIKFNTEHRLIQSIKFNTKPRCIPNLGRLANSQVNPRIKTPIL